MSAHEQLLAALFVKRPPAEWLCLYSLAIYSALEFVSPNEPEKKIVQKLPRSIQVNKVVAFAKQLFNTGGKTPSLSYVDTKLPDTEVPVDNIMRDLKFYSVEDGGRIVVRW
uniref:Uncharacterized protein n=1 Tax=Timema douglasi TaxID=61478 RepID=A0A7R8VVX9_TIMDO|nr:unnamed protein product [Timema douglasi]